MGPLAMTQRTARNCTVARDMSRSDMDNLSQHLCVQLKRNAREINHGFKKCDKHNTGKVSRAQFRWVLQSYFHTIVSESQLDRLVQLFTKNHDDHICYQDFLYYCNVGPQCTTGNKSIRGHAENAPLMFRHHKRMRTRIF